MMLKGSRKHRKQRRVEFKKITISPIRQESVSLFFSPVLPISKEVEDFFVSCALKLKNHPRYGRHV